jgi:transcriptional regulator with XRE-family HTH domain
MLYYFTSMQNKTLGTKIKSLRLHKGWTQADLAKTLGCTQGIITAYENGRKKPSIEKIGHIAQVLGATVDELLSSNTKTTRKSEKKAKSPKLWKRFEQVDRLPPADKRAIFKMIDGILAHKKTA